MENNNKNLENSIENLTWLLLDATNQATKTKLENAMVNIDFANSICDVLKKIKDLGIQTVNSVIEPISTNDTIPQIEDVVNDENEINQDKEEGVTK